MKVLWTKFALNSLHEIFNYYRDNVSYTVAQNIKNNILSGTHQLEKQPLSGPIVVMLSSLEKDSYRYIIRGNYKIIYKIQNKKIFIMDVFDTRQNPDRDSHSSSKLNEPTS